MGDPPPPLVPEGEVPRHGPPRVEDGTPRQHADELQPEDHPGRPDGQVHPPVGPGRGWPARWRAARRRVAESVGDGGRLEHGGAAHPGPNRMGTISEYP